MKILRGWNVCLAQLHSLAICTIISYIWVCRWMGFSESMSLFKRLHVLKKSSSATDAGWWSLNVAKGKMTYYPALSSLKDGNTRFYWLKVPADYPVNRVFTSPNVKMSFPSPAIDAKVEDEAFDYFENVTGTTEKDKDHRMPKTWLPNVKYILGNAELSAMKLCHTHRSGMLLSATSFYSFILLANF